jgi:hypothetical protein
MRLRAAATELAAAEAVVDVPVGTAATQETALTDLDPVAAAAFGIGDGTGAGRVSRAVAMRVPAVRRGRALIAGTIGTLPLVCYRTNSDGTVVPIQRKLLQQLDPSTTPAYTLTWTVDDLLFEGVSWWRVTGRELVNGEAIGYPTAAERIAPGRLTVDQVEQRVYVDGKYVPDADLIRFDGPDEGVLAYGGDTIRLALALSFAAKRVADDDWSGLVLRLAEGANELTRVQIDELLDAWEDARRRRSTAYLNRAVDPEKVSISAGDRQLTELQQLVSTELARLLNLPASRIGAPQGSGMTYTNTEADRRDLVDTTLAQYLAPIWQRLSMPDVTPNGQAVAVDLTAYLRGTTEQLVNAGKTAIDAGIADVDEVRTRWLGLPPRPASSTTQEGTPAP